MISKKKEPFNKVEEVLKERYFIVYGKSQICSQVRLKYDAKMALKER